MNLSCHFFNSFIEKHGKNSFDNLVENIFKEIDISTISNLNISKKLYIEYIFAIAISEFLNFDDYINIIFLNSSSEINTLKNCFNIQDIKSIHLKSIKTIISFLKQDYPSLYNS